MNGNGANQRTGGAHPRIVGLLRPWARSSRRRASPAELGRRDVTKNDFSVNPRQVSHAAVGNNAVSTSLDQCRFFADHARNGVRNECSLRCCERVDGNQGACCLGHVLAQSGEFGLTDGAVLASALTTARRMRRAGS